MKQMMILTGDVNLLDVTDPAVPLGKVASVLKQADVEFSNFECCLYDPPKNRAGQPTPGSEGFYAGVHAGQALKLGGIQAVGNANNVNYGAEAILSSCARLDELGVPHTGAGINKKAAREPIVLERKGTRFGFMQRTSVYWPVGHEAGEATPGVAAIKASTAYEPRANWNRPGVPPTILTWTDAKYLTEYKADVASLRQQADIVVSSHHWGFAEDVLQYQIELAHAAIDSGAHVVMGHGPHFPLGIEVYKGKPIFYGLGSFSFHTGHVAVHGDWIGLMAKITLEDKEITKVAFSPVRHNQRNETVIHTVQEEKEALKHVASLCEKFGTKLDLSGDEVVVWQKS